MISTTIKVPREYFKQYIIRNIDEILSRVDISIEAYPIGPMLNGDVHYLFYADVVIDRIPISSAYITTEEETSRA